MLLRLTGQGSEKRRLAVSIFLVGCVHVSLVFFGNENATPPKILASFALSTTLLMVSQRVRAKLLAPRAASTVVSPARVSAPPVSAP